MMWELIVRPKLIIPDATVPMDGRRFETTRELFEALKEYGVPEEFWWCGANVRHSHFGGRLVWEQLAHRVPAMYGEVWDR